MEYRFLPNVALSDNENPPRGIRSAKQDLWQVESNLSACLMHVQENYIKIGILLKKIKEETLYSFCSYEKENGETVPCRTVEEYAFLRFGLSKTVVFNSIAIVEKFLIRANDEDIAFYPKLNGFGYSALCELVPLTKNCTRYSSSIGTLPEWVEEEIKPEMSVKEIREQLHFDSQTEGNVEDLACPFEWGCNKNDTIERQGLVDTIERDDLWTV